MLSILINLFVKVLLLNKSVKDKNICITLIKINIMRNLLTKFSYQLGIYLLLPISLLQCDVTENASNPTLPTYTTMQEDIEPEITEDMVQLAKTTGYNTLVGTLHAIQLSQEIITNKNLALQEAIQLGNIPIIAILLANKVGDIEAKDHEGKTPLHIAAIKGNSELVSYLLEQRAPIDAQDKEGKTPLRWAAREGHVPVAKLLISSGCNLYIQDKQGKTAIQGAAAYAHFEIIDMLLETVEKRHGRSEKISIAKGLLNGWLPQVYTPGLTDQKYAHILGIHKILAKHGTNIIPQTEKEQKRLIAVAQRIGEQELVNHIQCKLIIDAKDHEGKTQLHKAAETGDTELVQKLLGQNAEIDIQDVTGQTPFHLACRTGHSEIVNMLIAHHADINKKDYQNNRPITEALVHEHIEVLKILKKQGMNLILDLKNINLILQHPNAEIKALLGRAAAMTAYFIQKSSGHHFEHNMIGMHEDSRDEEHGEN
jgi:ankyrin repeat protein